MAEKENKGSMTVAEAGRKGGETVRNERGREFYETIGRKGGATVKAERGRAFYEEIGRKGGQKVKKLIEDGKRAARAALEKEALSKEADQPSPLPVEDAQRQ